MKNDKYIPNTMFLQVRVRDRIGVVNEICGIIRNLDIDIISHGANVYTERSGITVSMFRAKISSDTPDNFRTLEKRCGKIKGFISVSCDKAV